MKPRSAGTRDICPVLAETRDSDYLSSYLWQRTRIVGSSGQHSDLFRRRLGEMNTVYRGEREVRAYMDTFRSSIEDDDDDDEDKNVGRTLRRH